MRFCQDFFGVMRFILQKITKVNVYNKSASGQQFIVHRVHWCIFPLMCKTYHNCSKVEVHKACSARTV